MTDSDQSDVSMYELTQIVYGMEDGQIRREDGYERLLGELEAVPVAELEALVEEFNKHFELHKEFGYKDCADKLEAVIENYGDTDE